MLVWKFLRNFVLSTCVGDKVLITWYEENEGPLPLKSIRFDFLVNIFVTPLKSGLYRIRVVRPKSWVR